MISKNLENALASLLLAEKEMREKLSNAKHVLPQMKLKKAIIEVELLQVFLRNNR